MVCSSTCSQIHRNRPICRVGEIGPSRYPCECFLLENQCFRNRRQHVTRWDQGRQTKCLLQFRWKQALGGPFYEHEGRLNKVVTCPKQALLTANCGFVQVVVVLIVRCWGFACFHLVLGTLQSPPHPLQASLPRRASPPMSWLPSISWCTAMYHCL